MFTGLVTEIGALKESLRVGAQMRLTISAPRTARETELGASININGVCQTVTRMNGDLFSVDTIAETMKKTTLGMLKPGDGVNLEQALKANDRMGGHIVQGHVDCIGNVTDVMEESNVIEISVGFPADFEELVVPQGSISIDGVSLTIARLKERMLTVAIIPATWRDTTLSNLKAGSSVNLEFDILGKYVARMLKLKDSNSQIDLSTLEKLGY
jgi:riboflavin synthase